MEFQIFSLAIVHQTTLIKSMISSSQTDFLGPDFKWRKALFSTYAMSLTFFETILLPQLRASECENIFVLLDSQGYNNSLIERRSNSAGKEYVLIPVQMKNSGIFHPKLTYLWGDEDILMVGSGNLTFGGHGRNVEVLEILRKNENTQAFLDFADFLDSLSIEKRIDVADSQPLNDFAGRARKTTSIVYRS